MRRAAASLLVGATVAAIGLTGCGSTAQGLSAQDSARLQSAVLAVNAAAEARNPTLARTDLGRLRTEVEDLRAAGRISSARAAAILAAVSSVQTELVAITTTTTTTTTTATTTTTVAPREHAAPQPPSQGGPGQGGPGQGGPGKHQGHGGH